MATSFHARTDAFATLLAGIALITGGMGFEFGRYFAALSGLLLEQADTVTSAYRPWFDIATAATRDGWALLAGRRRAD